MGNGPGLKPNTISVDIETSSLDPQAIQNAAAKAAASFGTPSQIFLPPQFFMMSGLVFDVNPQYRGTPWAYTSRMTKREHAVAGLHTTLFKLGVFKKLSEDNLEEIKVSTIKRLKRVKWARYQQVRKTT